MRPVRVAVVLATLALVACVDPPFARVNPNDGGADFEMSIVASSDAVSSEVPIVILQVITVPAAPEYAPIWTLSSNNVLSPRGNGVFARLPGDSTSVTVTARFGGRAVTKVITRLN